MTRRVSLLVAVIGGLAGASLVLADGAFTYAGLELSVKGVERVKAYRDLKVDNERKHDFVVVRLEVRWSAEKRHLLLEDDDLRLKDTRGKDYRCALKFVQSSAPADGHPTVLEIPFQVRSEAEPASLRVGKTIIPLEAGSAPAAP
jgi:hypothetical protein